MDTENKTSSEQRRELFLFMMEIKGFFFHLRSRHFVPLLLMGVFAIVWIYPVGSPMAAVVLVLLAGLETQFNNIFFRTPNELEAMILFPLSWKRVIIVKNFATLTLLSILFILTTIALLYYSPEGVAWGRISEALLFLSTIVFPLLHVGNTNSVQSPRKETGFRINDFVELVWMLLMTAILSVPYYFLMSVLDLPLLCILYGIGTAVIWYRFSVVKTARRLEMEKTKLCSNL